MSPYQVNLVVISRLPNKIKTKVGTFRMTVILFYFPTLFKPMLILLRCTLTRAVFLSLASVLMGIHPLHDCLI